MGQNSSPMSSPTVSSPSSSDYSGPDSHLASTQSLSSIPLSNSPGTTPHSEDWDHVPESHVDNLPISDVSRSGDGFEQVHASAAESSHHHDSPSRRCTHTTSGSYSQTPPLPVPMIATWVTDRLQKHTGELKQIITLSYDSFLKSIIDLNSGPLRFHDINGKELLFDVKKGTDATMFWRMTVRVHCHKVNSRRGIIESTRLLNMKQYIHLYNEITRQASIATLNPADTTTAGLCASVILSEFDSHGSEECMVTQDDECCICMDRKAVIILSCSHKYCEQCIDKWNFTNKTCPVCRARVKSNDDTWVLTEKPDKEEMAFETTGYLMGLADRSGVPSAATTTPASPKTTMVTKPH